MFDFSIHTTPPQIIVTGHLSKVKISAGRNKKIHSRHSQQQAAASSMVYPSVNKRYEYTVIFLV